MALYRSNQFQITLTVEGVKTDEVKWDSAEGGDATVESTGYLPGGMLPFIQLGGVPKRSALTLKRAWSTPLIEIFKALDAEAGRAVATVAIATLNTKGVAESSVPVITYTGVLGTVTRPNYGAEDAAVAYLQVVVDPNGPIT